MLARCGGDACERCMQSRRSLTHYRNSGSQCQSVGVFTRRSEVPFVHAPTEPNTTRNSKCFSPFIRIPTDFASRKSPNRRDSVPTSVPFRACLRYEFVRQVPLRPGFPSFSWTPLTQAVTNPADCLLVMGSTLAKPLRHQRLASQRLRLESCTQSRSSVRMQGRRSPPDTFAILLRRAI